MTRPPRNVVLDVHHSATSRLYDVSVLESSSLHPILNLLFYSTLFRFVPWMENWNEKLPYQLPFLQSSREVLVGAISADRRVQVQLFVLGGSSLAFRTDLPTFGFEDRV